MLNDKWFKAFIDSGSGVVALSTEETTEDSPASGDLSDLLSRCVTNDNKIRIAPSSL